MLTRLRMLTAGESHGTGLVGILDGMPMGVPVRHEAIAHDLRRRRVVAGRSARQSLEADAFNVVGGMRYGTTLGSPIGVMLPNAEHARFAHMMSPWPVDSPDAAVTVPRPGHADLAGAQKFNTKDLRNIIERSSARETAMRTALGAFARALLGEVGVTVFSHVTAIGSVASSDDGAVGAQRRQADADASAVRCLDATAAQAMLAAIEAARKVGDTLGGTFVVEAYGMPAGVGSFAQWDTRLSARLSEAVASVHATKAVGIGSAWHAGDAPGRQAHDVMHAEAGRATRTTNHAGGLEGGITNGMPIIVRAVQKPIATVAGGLPSVDIVTGEDKRGLVERSDTCAVPAGAVVAEAMVCLVLADALLVTFGGDTLHDLASRVQARHERG